jgi:hypothetical protein
MPLASTKSAPTDNTPPNEWLRRLALERPVYGLRWIPITGQVLGSTSEPAFAGRRELISSPGALPCNGGEDAA